MDKIVSISNFRTNYTKFLDDIISKDEHIILTSPKHNESQYIVMMNSKDYEEYNELKKLKSQLYIAKLEKSLVDAKNGNVIEIDLDNLDKIID